MPILVSYLPDLPFIGSSNAKCMRQSIFHDDFYKNQLSLIKIEESSLKVILALDSIMINLGDGYGFPTAAMTSFSPGIGGNGSKSKGLQKGQNPKLGNHRFSVYFH